MVSSSLRDVDISQKHVQRRVSVSRFHCSVAVAETFCNLHEPETFFRTLFKIVTIRRCLVINQMIEAHQAQSRLSMHGLYESPNLLFLRDQVPVLRGPA